MPVLAHGVGANEIDDCRIPIIGQWVHFTAYTPKLSGDNEYCTTIPELGLTTIVFDYEQKPLRKMKVEFEITKEPEGKRVFYQEPKVQKTGSMNAAIDFTPFGAGDYLVHATLVIAGKKIDAHLPFTVGVGDGWIIYRLIFIVIFVLFLFFFFRSPTIRSKVHTIVSGDGYDKKTESTDKQNL